MKTFDLTNLAMLMVASNHFEIITKKKKRQYEDSPGVANIAQLIELNRPDNNLSHF